MDGSGDVIGHGFKDQLIVFCKGIGAVGLDIEQANHFAIEDQRHTQFGADVLGRQGRWTITRFIQHIIGEHGLLRCAPPTG